MTRLLVCLRVCRKGTLWDAQVWGFGCAAAQSTGPAGMALSDEALARQLQRQMDMEDAELAAAQHDREPPRSDSHAICCTRLKAHEQDVSERCTLTIAVATWLPPCSMP